MHTTLLIIQIVISVLLVIAVLLQSSSAGLGGAFGDSGSNEGGHHTRRGFERFLFISTIVLGIAFGIVSFLAFVIV